MTQNLPTRHTAAPLVQVEERSPKNRMVAFTLACLTGYWGLHRFYTGRFWTGLAMFLTGGGFLIWWIIDVLILMSGRFKDGEGRVLGPPRKARQRPAGRLTDDRPRHSAPPGRSEDDDVTMDELLEDPLECEFKKLEEEMSADGTL